MSLPLLSTLRACAAEALAFPDKKRGMLVEEYTEVARPARHRRGARLRAQGLHPAARRAAREGPWMSTRASRSSWRRSPKPSRARSA
ncbi:MAG: hypothetical protein WDN72_08330 [Alphaproteobacteria bacterium]